MGKMAYYGVITLLLLLVIGCSISGNTIKQSETIQIGQLAGLTGFSDVWGIPEQEAVALAVKEVNAQGGINGKPVQIILEDTHSDFTQTLTAYNKLVHVDGVNVVFGPTFNEFTQVILPKAKEDGTLIMSFTASYDKSPVQGSLFFSTSHSLRWLNYPMVQDMKLKGYKKIVIIREQNQFIEFLHAFLLEELQKEGIDVVLEIETKPEDTDYRTHITKIKTTDADAVYVLQAQWKNIGEFLKQAHSASLNLPLYTTFDVQNDEFIKNYGAYADGIIYFWSAEGPGYESFTKKYEQEYGHPPNAPSAATAYDGANLVFVALKNGAKTSEEIAAYLRSVKNYQGADAPITFDEYGQLAYREYYLKTIKEGRFARYSP